MYSALADLGLLLCVLVVVASAIAFWKDVRDLRKRHPPQDRGFEVILAKQQGEALNVQPLSDHGEPGRVGDDDVHKLDYAGLHTKSPLSATLRRLIAGAAVILAAALLVVAASLAQITVISRTTHEIGSVVVPVFAVGTAVLLYRVVVHVGNWWW
jgi:hypothetical protein